MNEDELKEKLIGWNVEGGTIILEPQKNFNKRIIGVTEDECYLVYDFQKLVVGMAGENFMNKSNDDERTFEDFLQEASEWVDYNTIRSLPYMNEKCRPVIIYEF